MTPPSATIARFAVIGSPVQHSLSPALHQLFAQQLGITLIYEKIEVSVPAFQDVVQDFFEQGGKGLNVTLPHKHRAFELCGGQVSERARLAQAVNTLWVEGGQLHGCNTDGVGLISDIRRLGQPLQGANVLVLGAGGAACGALSALMESGCRRLHIANRTAAKAHDLAAYFQSRLNSDQRLTAGGLDALPVQQDIVINASASSLGGSELPLRQGLFNPKSSLAYDMVYSADGSTSFLTQSRAAGAACGADGLGMLVYQGAESFRIWNGRQVEAAPVIAQLRQQMAGHS